MSKRLKIEDDEFENWSRDELIEELLKLRLEIKEMKQESSAFESDLIPWRDDEIDHFVPDFEKKMSADELMSQRNEFIKLVDAAVELSPNEDKESVVTHFDKLKYVYQRDYFFYLVEAKARSDDRMDLSDKRINNLSELEWLRVILKICGSCEYSFGQTCIGSEVNGKRIRVSIYKSHIVVQRLICGLVYGFATLRGRHASHRCGNSTCLLSAHLYPEAAAKNNDRDFCHTGERQICNHTYAPCVQSLKLGTSGKVGSVVGALIGRPLAEIEGLVMSSKTVAIYEDRKHNAKGSGNYYCSNRSSSDCPGRFKIVDSMFYNICVHDDDCPILTQAAEEKASNRRIVHLTENDVETKRRKIHKKDEYANKTYIKIDDRTFSAHAGRSARPNTFICTNKNCSCAFTLESDGDNVHGKAVFRDNANHSPECDEVYKKRQEKQKK